MTVRLVACDLDGTLIASDNQLSPRVSAAVAAAIDAGLWVVAVTGRPWQWTLPLAREHRLLPAAVCSNGSALVEVDTGEVTYTGFADAAVTELVQRVRDVAPGVRFAVDHLDRLAHEPGFLRDERTGPSAPPADSQHEQLLSDVPRLVEDIASVLDAGVVKLIARVPGMHAPVLAALLDHEVLAGVCEPLHGRGPTSEWVELHPVGASKAAGLAALCERLGVDRHEVVAAGDEWNDVAMLEWAGVGVAVGDAVPEVVAAADRVVPPSTEDGVALLLEELVRP